MSRTQSLFISERLKIVQLPPPLFLPLLSEQLNPKPIRWGRGRLASAAGGCVSLSRVVEPTHGGWCGVSEPRQGEDASTRGWGGVGCGALVDWGERPHRKAAWCGVSDPQGGEEIIHTGRVRQCGVSDPQGGEEAIC